MERVFRNKEQIVFISEINETIANAIRRYVNHIPIVAIDSVEIYKNDSPTYDETIAHRIGLVPLKPKDKSKRTGKMVLNLIGERVVYSGDLNGDFEVVYKNMPITILSKNQELSLVADVREGLGIEHTRFSPGVITYRNVVEIRFDKKFYEEIRENLNVFQNIEIKEKGNKIVLIDNKKKPIADFCEGLAERKGGRIEIEDLNKLIITVESFGQLNPDGIFIESIHVLKKDLSDLVKELDRVL